MRHYIYSLQSEKDLEKITDDIYEQDMLESATSVVLELFSAGKHKNILQRLSDFLIEKYPELAEGAQSKDVFSFDEIDRARRYLLFAFGEGWSFATDAICAAVGAAITAGIPPYMNTINIDSNVHKIFFIISPTYLMFLKNT